MSNHRRGQRNFSTQESREAFIFVCETESLYKEHYHDKVAKESSVPPYITIIGTLLDPKTVLCDFENIMYKVYSLPKAIDICFKAYHLLSMEYSPAARLMWQFINKQFYGLKDAGTYPALHMLLKTIRGNLTAIYSLENRKIFLILFCIQQMLMQKMMNQMHRQLTSQRPAQSTTMSTGTKKTLNIELFLNLLSITHTPQTTKR